MVTLRELQGFRVYLDTNVFIYAVEGSDDREVQARALFTAVDEGRISGVTSELTLAECLVVPYRTANTQAQSLYARALTSRRGFDVVPVSRAVLRDAAILRARSAIRLPDAIHLATAVESGCTHVITNDLRLASDAIRMIRVEELSL